MPRWDSAIELDGREAYLCFTCPLCGTRNRHPMRGVSAGDTVACVCGGATVELAGDDIANIQEVLDSLEKAIGHDGLAI
jgi:hypothetical protein